MKQLRKTEKNMEKENNNDESDFGENEIPDLNSLKPFEFEPKTNIVDINSSSSDGEEEGAEYKVKWISNNKRSEYSASVRKCSVKKVFLEILLNSQENESAKSRAWRALCLLAHVLGVFACLHAGVLACLACLRPCVIGVFACLRACIRVFTCFL